MDVAYSGGVESEQKRRWWLRFPDRLPDLTGKWLTFYTVIWAIVLPLAIIGPVRTTYISAGYYAKPAWLPHGFGVKTLSDGLKISSVTSADAERAGVRAGDRIVAIDGWNVPHSSAAGAIARTHMIKSEGSSTIFTLAAPGRPPRDVRLTYTRRHFEEPFTRAALSSTADEVIQFGANLLISAALVAAAILLFIRQRRKAVPAFLSLGFMITAATAWGTDWGDLGLSYLISDLINLFGWALIFAALLAFPSGKLSPRWTRFAILVLPLFCLLPALTRSDFVVLPIFGLFFMAATASLVGRYRRLPAGAERQQLRWVFFGFIAGSAMLVLTILWQLLSEQLQSVDPRWYVWIVFEGFFSAAGVILIALGLSVSILRYRLYDADTVIGRSAAYGVLTVGFIGLFAGSEKLTELIGERYFEHSVGIAAGAIGAAVAAVCIVPLHNRVHRWAERRFQKPLMRLRDGLPECVADLRESAPIKQLTMTVMTRVRAGVHSTREAVVLRERGKWHVAGAHGLPPKDVREWQRGWKPRPGDAELECDRSDSLFPVRVRLCIETGDEPETIGWLVLGPRPDGSLFGRDERETLTVVAGPIARAMHIAQLRERRDAAAEKRIGTLEALIAKLASTIGGGAPPHVA